MKKKQQTRLKFKVIFVMNFDKNANVWHYMKIKKENRKFKDLMITKVEDNYKTVGKLLNYSGLFIIQSIIDKVITE